MWAEVLTRPEHDPPVRTVYSDDNLPIVRLSRLCAIVWSGALIKLLVQPHVSLICPADRPIFRAEHVRLGLAFTEVYFRVQLSLALAFRWFVLVECANSTSLLLAQMAQIRNCTGPVQSGLFQVAGLIYWMKMLGAWPSPMLGWCSGSGRSECVAVPGP